MKITGSHEIKEIEADDKDKALCSFGCIGHNATLNELCHWVHECRIYRIENTRRMRCPQCLKDFPAEVKDA